jgi:hypothetical protein
MKELDERVQWWAAQIERPTKRIERKKGVARTLFHLRKASKVGTGGSGGSSSFSNSTKRIPSVVVH